MFWCISVLIDTIKVLLICVGILKIPLKKAKIKYLPVIYILSAAFLQIIDYGSKNIFYSNVCLFVMLIMVTVLLEEKKYVAFLTYIAEMFVEVIFLVLYSYITQTSLQILMEDRKVEVCIGLIFVVVICLIAIFIRKKNTNNIAGVLSFKVVLMLGIGLLAVCMNIVSVHIIVSSEYMGETFQQRSLIFTTIGTLTFIILIILFLVKDYLAYQYKEKVEMASYIMEEQQKYCELLIQKSEETRKLRHDMNNHISSIDYLLRNERYEEAGDYVRELNHQIEELRLVYDTGNELLNAMLGELGARYELVTTQIQGESLKALSIPLIDVSTIFYNLFNNAFEAASISKDRIVSMLVKTSGNSLHIIICNSVDKRVKIVNNSIQTSKKDRINHGYGINNAKVCIENIGGSLELSCSDKEFKAEIVLLNAFS